MARRLCGEDNYPAALLAVAGYPLPHVVRPFPARPLDECAWAGLLESARTHRVLGQLRAATDAGALPVNAEQAEQARNAHRCVLLRVLSLEAELIGVVDLLTSAGIEYKVLKGSSFAHLDYPQPALRSFIDLDVLVRAGDFDHAVAVLTEAGFARTLAQPRPGFDRRFDKGTTLRNAKGYELDLHRTFVLGPWGVLVDLDELWQAGETFELGGRALTALSRPHRFLHACYHAALGDWPLRLGSLRDVTQLLPRTDTEATALIRTAERWGVAAVVAAAVADAVRLLGVASSDVGSARTVIDWARAYVPNRQEEGRLALHTHAQKTFAAQALATVPALPTLRAKAAYLRALALPDREYTMGRHTSALSRFRFALREARKGRN